MKSFKIVMHVIAFHFNITVILYCRIGMTITNYPSYCTVIPDGPCHQKAVMIDDDKKPCTGPVAAVGR